MYRHRSAHLALVGSPARAGGPSNPVFVGEDPRLPRVGEIVALHRREGPRLWVGRVRSAYDKAVSVAFHPAASRPAGPEMPDPEEPVELSGLAGTPIDAHATVRGHKDTVVLLRDVTATEQRPERSDVSVRAHGRLWCEDVAGTGCGVEVVERFADGLSISAPDWAHPGDEVAIAGPMSTAGPVPALVVARREARHRQTVAHVAFLPGASGATIQSLLAGLSNER